MSSVTRPLSTQLLLCLSLAGFIAAAGTASAQTPPPPVDQSAVEAFASGPKPGTTQANATFGFQVQTGRTETLGYTLDGVLAHMTTHKQLVRFAAQEGHGEYRPAPGAARLTVENSHAASLDLIQGVAPHVGIMAGLEFRRDTILALDYRVYGRGGVGLLFDNKDASFMVGVGGAVGREHSLVPNAPSSYLGVGVQQSLTWHPTPTFVVEDTFSSVVNTSDSGDRTTTLRASATARIASHAGLKVAYTYQYDQVHPIFVSATQQQFTMGVQVFFTEK